jgi:hypothetical protein
VDLGVGPCLQADQDQRKNGQRDLEPLRAPLFRTEFAATPLCGWLSTQPPDPREDSKVYHRSHGREDEHGNADGVLMKPARGGVDAADRGQRGEADGHAKPADSEHGSTQALQQGGSEADATQGAQSLWNFLLISSRQATSQCRNAELPAASQAESG